MPEISDKELERYKRIESAAHEDLEGIGHQYWPNLRKALKPIHTPLVSDEELRKAYDEVYKGHNFTDALRAVSALTLRKAREQTMDFGGNQITAKLHQWEDELSSKSDADVS